MSQGRLAKISSTHEGIETVVCNRCSYQVTDMVVSNSSQNEKHKFYNSNLQAIPHLEKIKIL